MVRLVHKGNIDQQIAGASAIFEHVREGYYQLGREWKALAGVEITNSERGKLVADILGIDLSDKGELPTRTVNRLIEVSEILAGGYGARKVPETKGSLWGVYNGVTEWVDHTLAQGDGIKDAMNYANFSGAGAKLKGRAYSKVIDQAGTEDPFLVMAR